MSPVETHNSLSGEQILQLPMQENGAEAKTIGEYLQKLLLELWENGEGFSSKRPFGNSCWDYELYSALAVNNATPHKIYDYEEEGVEYSCTDTKHANGCINRAILALYTR